MDCRINSGKENRRQVKSRAKNIMILLEKNNDVTIISHGFLLFYLKKYLKEKQYKRIDKFKNGCFTVEEWDK